MFLERILKTSSPTALLFDQKAFRANHMNLSLSLSKKRCFANDFVEMNLDEERFWKAISKISPKYLSGSPGSEADVEFAECDLFFTLWLPIHPKS